MGTIGSDGFNPATQKSLLAADPPSAGICRNGFGTAHLVVFIVVWGAFTALTYYIAEVGLDDGPEHRRAVIITTLASLTGPMVGAISRDLQSCCLECSLSLLPYCGAFLAAGTLTQLLNLPRWTEVRLAQIVLWLIGLIGWFAGGILSFGHALS